MVTGNDNGNGDGSGNGNGARYDKDTCFQVVNKGPFSASTNSLHVKDSYAHVRLLGLLNQTPGEENRMNRAETFGEPTLSVDIILVRGNCVGASSS